MNPISKTALLALDPSDLISRGDLSIYESRAHSVRLKGVVTSIRLENLYWTILAEIADANLMTTSQLISRLYEEMLDVRTAVPNLASLVRVTCLRYLSLKVADVAEVETTRLGPASRRPGPEGQDEWLGRRRPERVPEEASPDR
jgi:predicted DNA-binding ribbon-helix-helix protein